MNIPMPAEGATKFKMTPMIDMVFLLLVFFMCASHLSTVQNKELIVPTATKAIVPKERPNRFIVNIDIDGQLYGGSEAFDLASLKDRVAALKDEDPGIRIYLRADQKTPHKHVKKVMNAMGELGISDFIFAAFIPDA